LVFFELIIGDQLLYTSPYIFSMQFLGYHLLSAPLPFTLGTGLSTIVK